MPLDRIQNASVVFL